MTTLRESGWTAIDFETTGRVEGWPDQPWQIAVASFTPDGGVETAEAWLGVPADRPFNPYAPGRHAELREMLAEQPTLADCWGEWRDRLGGRILVAHNASTEQRVLRESVPMERLGPWVDTLALARAAWPDLETHGLGDLVTALGLEDRVGSLCPGRSPHDALYDAVACGLLLAHLLDQPGWQEVSAGQAGRFG